MQRLAKLSDAPTVPKRKGARFAHYPVENLTTPFTDRPSTRTAGTAEAGSFTASATAAAVPATDSFPICSRLNGQLGREYDSRFDACQTSSWYVYTYNTAGAYLGEGIVAVLDWTHVDGYRRTITTKLSSGLRSGYGSVLKNTWGQFVNCAGVTVAGGCSLTSANGSTHPMSTTATPMVDTITMSSPGTATVALSTQLKVVSTAPVGTPRTISGTATVSPTITCDTGYPGMGTASGCVFRGYWPTFLVGTEWPNVQQTVARSGRVNPDLLHREINTAVQQAHRDAACLGFVPNVGEQCDEYPYASSKEGGSGAAANSVPALENSSHGGTLGNWLVKNHLRDNDPFYNAVVSTTAQN